MSRVKAKAIAVTQPFISVLDFMYGTPERTQMTVMFSLFLIAASMVIAATAGDSLGVCPA